jgi:hypothetical protein
MATPVSDYRSNPNEHIHHAVNVLKRAPRRRRVFEEIYRGSKKSKTVEEIMKATGLSQVAVLQEGGRLASEQLVVQVKVGGRTAYQKERVYVINKHKIARYLADPKKLGKLPTKQTPKSAAVISVIRVPGIKIQASIVSCDDFDQFAKVRKVDSGPKVRILEKNFKEGIKKLIGESGKFVDWGGEKNDLYSTRILVRGSRYRIAFAFKGPATRGTLTPAKLGKNGDQIQRLFESPAEIFVVQYHGQVAETVWAQMQAWAEITSIRFRKRVWYGVIDGDDTNRLIAAYLKAFRVDK